MLHEMWGRGWYRLYRGRIFCAFRKKVKAAVAMKIHAAEKRRTFDVLVDEVAQLIAVPYTVIGRVILGEKR